MDTRRSYHLHSKQDDFAEPAAESRLDFDDVPFVMPANDDSRIQCFSFSRRVCSKMWRVGHTKRTNKASTARFWTYLKLVRRDHVIVTG